MKDEIRLLNEKLDYLTDGSRRLHGLYDKSIAKAKNVQNELDTCEEQNLETRSKNQVCERTVEGMGQNIISVLMQHILFRKISERLISKT